VTERRRAHCQGRNLYVETRTPGINDAAYLGSYGLSVVTGTLAAALAASAVVYSARWVTRPRSRS